MSQPQSKPFRTVLEELRVQEVQQKKHCELTQESSRSYSILAVSVIWQRMIDQPALLDGNMLTVRWTLGNSSTQQLVGKTVFLLAWYQDQRP